MQNITIGRYEADPEAQGVVKSEDERWQVVVDKDGFPHFYVQVNIRDDDGKLVKGLFNLDDILGPNLNSVRELMEEGEFGGSLTPEEEEEAHKEWLERKAKLGIPCPR